MSASLRVLCALLLLFQPSSPSAAAPPSGAVTAGTLMLEDGTPVKLRISRTVSSADAHVNDRVEFEVLEDVKVGDVLVIPKGGIAWGTVTEAQPKRRMARGGKLEIVMDSVRLVDGQKAALRAVKEGKGGGHVGGMTIGIVAAAIVFWPAAPLFLLMHGKDITFPKGTDVPTFINGDMKLNAAKFQQTEEFSAQTPATGVTTNVAINSTPVGAEIYLDEAFVGNAPSTLSAPSGRHSISVKKNGYQDWAREMNFSGGTVTLIAELTPGLSTPAATPVKKTYTVTEVPPSSSAGGHPARPLQNSVQVEVETPPGWIGVSTKRSTTGGATVTAVVPNGPAANAGIKVGDVIQALNGTNVKDEDFEAEISTFKPGTKILITYLRSAWAHETLLTVSKNTI